MEICRVRNNLFAWNGWLTRPLVPEKPRTLTDLHLVEHRLVRHRAPANREIDRHERSEAIVAINLAVQDARIELEMGQRCKVKLAGIKSHVVRRGIALHRILRDQDARWISERRVHPAVGEPSQDNNRAERKQLHQRNSPEQI